MKKIAKTLSKSCDMGALKCIYSTFSMKLTVYYWAFLEPYIIHSAYNTQMKDAYYL
jgi:hypothetical protein